MGYQSLQLYTCCYWANLLAYFYKVRNESKIIFKLKVLVFVMLLPILIFLAI